VPRAFDGAVTASIPANGSADIPFEIVRYLEKAQSPLVQLVNNTNEIATIAIITFYGTDAVGNVVSAVGQMTVNFAKFWGPMRASHLFVTALAAVVLTAGCQHKTEVPALSGPSSLSTTLNVTATPDRISQDGSAQSSVQIQAIGPDGKVLSGVPIRVDLLLDGVLQDYGTLSSKSVVTGSDGIARTVYTAPPPATNQTINTVTVRAVALGNDAQATHIFSADIRLMPIGVILPPANPPVPSFTISPQPVLLNVPSTFDASASTPGAGSASITSYAWNFGDGGTASGRVVTTHLHHDWNVQTAR
jgi:hypothetical protein